MTATSGIYRIWIGERYYWGRSKRVECRIRQHARQLCNGSHGNPYMQAAFNKCGKFRGQLVRVIDDPVTLAQYESAIIARHFSDRKCLNARTENGDGTFRLSEETRRRMSEKSRGRKHSEKSRKLISAKRRGVKLCQPHRDNVAVAMRGNRNRQRHVELNGPNGEAFYFHSATAAASYFGCSYPRLCARLSGKRAWNTSMASKAHGWTGRYLDMEELQNAYR